MTKLPRAILWLAALTLPGTAIGQTRAAQPCLNERESEAVLLYLAPELLAQVNRICAPSLPANAFLRRSGTLAQRYSSASSEAWPAARAAVAKIAGPDVRPLLESSFAGPAVASLVAPLVTGQIKPADCPRIDRILSLMEPLPPKNTAGLVVAFMQLAGERERQAGRMPPLPICTGNSR